MLFEMMGCRTGGMGMITRLGDEDRGPGSLAGVLV